MPSLTLVEAQKLQQNPLISGVIESIVTVNQIYSVMPFDQIVGNALAYTRELSIGGVAPIGIGGGSNSIPAGAKTPATVSEVTSPLKAMIGDALVDHFTETTMNTQNNQKAVQVASKAKALGREYQRQFLLGDTTSNTKEFNGLNLQVPSTNAQYYNASSAAFSFELLDRAISMVKSKDGQVDFFMMNDEMQRKYFSLLRALGGAGIGEVMTLPGGGSVPVYRGVPLFRNDWLPITVSGSDRLSDLYAGNWDDGSRKVGIAGLTSQVNSGIFVTNVGESEESNDSITRLRFYSGLAIFSELGIARLADVKVN